MNATETNPHFGMSFTHIRLFHKLDEIGNNAILASEALLCEKMLPPVGIEPGPLIVSDSKSNTILSTLT